jgi:hypothetical protein
MYQVLLIYVTLVKYNVKGKYVFAGAVSFRLFSFDYEERCNANCENELGVFGRQQVSVSATRYGHGISPFGRNDDGD